MRPMRAAAMLISTIAVACVPAASSPRPSISGDPVVGATLSVSSGAWTNDPTTFHYSWESCTTVGVGCVRVGGDRNTYLITAGDLGRHIRATVTATNAAGSGWSGSDSVGPVTSGEVPSVDCDVRGPGADLHGCDLSEEDLSETDLTGANLDGADLTGANLSGALLGAVSAQAANFYQADLSGADLSGAGVDGANLEYTDLSTADLSGASAQLASFFQANAVGAVMVDIDLTGADLTGADLTDADLTGAVFSNTTCPTGAVVSAPGVCS